MHSTPKAVKHMLFSAMLFGAAGVVPRGGEGAGAAVGVLECGGGRVPAGEARQPDGAVGAAFPRRLDPRGGRLRRRGHETPRGGAPTVTHARSCAPRLLQAGSRINRKIASTDVPCGKGEQQQQHQRSDHDPRRHISYVKGLSADNVPRIEVYSEYDKRGVSGVKSSRRGRNSRGFHQARRRGPRPPTSSWAGRQE
eukprot:1175792-Prorocentrum_minimum.AAC.1